MTVPTLAKFTAVEVAVDVSVLWFGFCALIVTDARLTVAALGRQHAI